MKKCKHNTLSDLNGSLNIRKIVQTTKHENVFSFSDFVTMLKEKCEKSDIIFKFAKKKH